MRYLGLDLGSRTLGVAKSDPLGMIASSYTVIRHNEEYDRLLTEVKNLVEELKIEAIVLGFPKNMNNTIGPKEVIMQDERLTTKSATDMLINGNVRRNDRKKVVDAVAATIILQSFLDRKGN